MDGRPNQNFKCCCRWRAFDESIIHFIRLSLFLAWSTSTATKWCHMNYNRWMDGQRKERSTLDWSILCRRQTSILFHRCKHLEVLTAIELPMLLLHAPCCFYLTSVDTFCWEIVTSSSSQHNINPATAGTICKDICSFIRGRSQKERRVGGSSRGSMSLKIVPFSKATTTFCHWHFTERLMNSWR